MLSGPGTARAAAQRATAAQAAQKLALKLRGVTQRMVDGPSKRLPRVVLAPGHPADSTWPLASRTGRTAGVRGSSVPLTPVVWNVRGVTERILPQGLCSPRSDAQRRFAISFSFWRHLGVVRLSRSAEGPLSPLCARLGHWC